MSKQHFRKEHALAAEADIKWQAGRLAKSQMTHLCHRQPNLLIAKTHFSFIECGKVATSAR